MVYVVMEKQFFIHGKPSSGESTGTNVFDGLGERITDEVFKSSQQMKTPCLKCEIRKWKQSSFSVFTYYRNGFDCYGSQNGFCALTLIVKDYYCIKVVSVYNLLEFIYKSGLQDTLHCIDQAGKYLINSYKDVPLLSALPNDVFARLDDSLFRPIDQSFRSNTGIERYCQFHPIDADSEAFFSAFREDGIVIVSPTFKSNSDKIMQLQNEVEGVSRLQSENALLKKTTEEQQHRLSELEEKSKKNPTITQSDNSDYIKKIEKENQNLRRENEQLQKKDIAKPTQDLNIVADRIVKSIKPTDWIHYVNFVLICICLSGVFKCTQDEMSINPSEDSDVVDISQPVDYVALNQDLDSLKNTMTQIKAISVSQIKHSGRSTTIQKNNPVILSLSIDSNNYNPNQLEWGVDVIYPGDAVIRQDTLIGKNAGYVTVKCVYNGIIVNRRDIEITN